MLPSTHCVNDGAFASLCAVPVLQVAAQNHLAAIQPEFHTNLIDAVAELQTDLNTFAQEYTEVRDTLECVQAFVVWCCSQLVSVTCGCCGVHMCVCVCMCACACVCVHE